MVCWRACSCKLPKTNTRTRPKCASSHHPVWRLAQRVARFHLGLCKLLPALVVERLFGAWKKRSEARFVKEELDNRGDATGPASPAHLQRRGRLPQNLELRGLNGRRHAGQRLFFVFCGGIVLEFRSEAECVPPSAPQSCPSPPAHLRRGGGRQGQRGGGCGGAKSAAQSLQRRRERGGTSDESRGRAAPRATAFARQRSDVSIQTKSTQHGRRRPLPAQRLAPHAPPRPMHPRGTQHQLPWATQPRGRPGEVPPRRLPSAPALPRCGRPPAAAVGAAPGAGRHPAAQTPRPPAQTRAALGRRAFLSEANSIAPTYSGSVLVAADAGSSGLQKLLIETIDGRRARSDPLARL